MRVTIFDYGAGNLHSLQKALSAALAQAFALGSDAASGGDVRIESDVLACLRTDVLVLPGVGAFGQAAARIGSARAAVRGAVQAGLPLIGICLGMQLLLDESEEGRGEGLGIIPGRVERLRSGRVPHMGWNVLSEAHDPAVARADLSWAYYANSYVAVPDEPSCVTAWTSGAGGRFPAVVRAGSALGVQFHPEKSSSAGIRFLAAALAECAA